MVNTFMDADGKHWIYESMKPRLAGPFEYYVDPYSKIFTGNYPKVVYTGERRTQEKVLVVRPRSNIVNKTWSNH